MVREELQQSAELEGWNLARAKKETRAAFRDLRRGRLDGVQSSYEIFERAWENLRQLAEEGGRGSGEILALPGHPMPVSTGGYRCGACELVFATFEEVALHTSAHQLCAWAGLHAGEDRF